MAIQEDYESEADIINATISANADSFTKAELARALFDVLDGNSAPDDIVYYTGLSEERAEQISKLFADLAKNV